MHYLMPPFTPRSLISIPWFRVEDSHKAGKSSRLHSNLNSGKAKWFHITNWLMHQMCSCWFSIQSVRFPCFPESESGLSSGSHTAATANQRASNVGRGKDGPGVIKMEGMHIWSWVPHDNDQFIPLRFASLENKLRIFFLVHKPFTVVG